MTKRLNRLRKILILNINKIQRFYQVLTWLNKTAKQGFNQQYVMKGASSTLQSLEREKRLSQEIIKITFFALAKCGKGNKSSSMFQVKGGGALPGIGFLLQGQYSRLGEFLCRQTCPSVDRYYPSSISVSLSRSQSVFSHSHHCVTFHLLC